MWVIAAIPDTVIRRAISLLMEFPAVTDLTTVMLSNISVFGKTYSSASCHIHKNKAQFGLRTVKISEV